MQKPAKRKCPTCGGAVRVTNSVALVNTPRQKWKGFNTQDAMNMVNGNNKAPP